jgi:hypothetical protein
LKRLSALGFLALGLVACGDRGEAQTDERVQQMAQELAPEVERAVGLPFKSPPVVALRSPEQVRAYMLVKLDDEMPPRRMQGVTLAYRLFGLLPDTLDLRALLLSLYTEQVVGFYDPDSLTLYVVDGADPLVLKMTLAHELVHALQGQYVALDTLLESTRENDRRVAAQAVLEGEATLASLLALMPEHDLDAIPDFAGTYRQALKEQHAAMPVFNSAPLIIQESIVFPYLEGANFIRWFRNAHGDTVPYGERMPQSTEQILHPDRYRERDDPVSLELANRRPMVYSDGLGEFEIRVLLTVLTGSESTARAGALAWAGDRYAVYPAANGEFALVWWSAWDHARAADRFATLLKRLWPARTDGRRLVIEREPVGGRPGVRLVDAPTGWDGWRDMPRVRRGESKSER